MSATSPLHKFYTVLESTYGAQPATPALALLSILGTTLALAKQPVESEQITTHRQVHDVRGGNRQVGGEISGEFAWTRFDTALQAVFCGTWTGNVLAPGSTRRSFTILRHYTDITAGATNYPFHSFRGCVFNTFSLNVTPGAIVKCTFGLFGRELVLLDSAPAGATYPAETSVRPFDGFTGSITLGGVAQAEVTELNLTVENGIEPRFVLFSDKSNEPKLGKFRVKGTLTAYFADSKMLQAFSGSELQTLNFVLTDPDGETLTFNLPAVMFTSGQADVSGETDITIPLSFTAIYEEGATTCLSITRST